MILWEIHFTNKICQEPIKRFGIDSSKHASILTNTTLKSTIYGARNLVECKLYESMINSLSY